MELTQKDLHSLFFYDYTTGECYWRKRPISYCDSVGRQKSWNNKFAYKSVGWVSSTGHRQCAIFHKKYILHRLIWLYVYGYLPDVLIDHIDQNPLNNKINNLRVGTRIINAINTGINANNTSGVTGVSWSKKEKLWEAYITVNKKRINLGRYKNFNDAVLTRFKAEQEYGFDKYQNESSAFNYLLTDLLEIKILDRKVYY